MGLNFFQKRQLHFSKQVKSSPICVKYAGPGPQDPTAFAAAARQDDLRLFPRIPA
jgi:hypothetical protein